VIVRRGSPALETASDLARLVLLVPAAGEAAFAAVLAVLRQRSPEQLDEVYLKLGRYRYWKATLVEQAGKGEGRGWLKQPSSRGTRFDAWWALEVLTGTAGSSANPEGLIDFLVHFCQLWDPDSSNDNIDRAVNLLAVAPSPVLARSLLHIYSRRNAAGRKSTPPSLVQQLRSRATQSLLRRFPYFIPLSRAEIVLLGPFLLPLLLVAPFLDALGWLRYFFITYMLPIRIHDPIGFSQTYREDRLEDWRREWSACPALFDVTEVRSALGWDVWLWRGIQDTFLARAILSNEESSLAPTEARSLCRVSANLG
jgi:hypothetical protein